MLPGSEEEKDDVDVSIDSSTSSDEGGSPRSTEAASPRSDEEEEDGPDDEEDVRAFWSTEVDEYGGMAHTHNSETLKRMADVCRQLARRVVYKQKHVYARGLATQKIDYFSANAALKGLKGCTFRGLTIKETNGAKMVFERLLHFRMVVFLGNDYNKLSVEVGLPNLSHAAHWKVAASYRFNPKHYAPVTFRASVIAVEGLPKDVESCDVLLSFCGQLSKLRTMRPTLRKKKEEPEDEEAASEGASPYHNFFGTNAKKKKSGFRSIRDVILRGGVRYARRAASMDVVSEVHNELLFLSADKTYETYGLDPEDPRHIQHCKAADDDDADDGMCDVVLEWRRKGCDKYERRRCCLEVDSSDLKELLTQENPPTSSPKTSPRGKKKTLQFFRGKVPCPLIKEHRMGGFKLSAKKMHERRVREELGLTEASRWVVVPGGDEKEEPIRLFVSCYLTNVKFPSGFTVQRDLERQKWSIYTRVLEVEGARSGVPILLKSQVMVEVAAKVCGVEAATTLKQKNFAKNGSEWDEQLTTTCVCARGHANLRVAVYERLRTDLSRTRRLGYATLKLEDVPIVDSGEEAGDLVHHRKLHLVRPLRFLHLPGDKFGNNGTVTVFVAMRPLLGAIDRKKFKFRRNVVMVLFFVGLYLAWAFLARFCGPAIATLALSPVLWFWLFAELPQLTAAALTKILKVVAPSLRLTLGSVRLQVFTQDTKRSSASPPHDIAALAANASRRLVLNVACRGVRIGNPEPGNYTHRNFVSAENVNLQISVDRRLFDGLADALYSCWRKNTRLIRWEPFPTKHEDLRRKTLAFEPQRLGALRVEHLEIKDCLCVFNMDSVRHEFNVCAFLRGLAEDKVRSVVKSRPPPNTLLVTIVSATGLPAEVCHPRVRVSLRHSKYSTSTRTAFGQAAVFNQSFRMECPDPSSVLHLSLENDGSALRCPKVVGQWLVTTKMLVVAPLNVYGEDLVVSSKDDNFTLEGSMTLRDGLWHPVSGARLQVSVSYFHDEKSRTHLEMLGDRRTTALEQLQMNSLETSLRLGSLPLMKKMLMDFPVLFEIQSFEITGINFFFKELFGGHGTSESRASVIRRRSVANQKFLRFGRICSDAVHIPRLDLREALRPPLHSPEGVSLWFLAKTMCTEAVMPVLRRVNYTEAVGHIFSGLVTGMSMGAPSSELKKKKHLRKALHLSAYYEHYFEELRLQNRSLRDRLHRDYMYKTASKYLTAADYSSGVLLGPPVISGLLWKRTRKPLFGNVKSATTTWLVRAAGGGAPPPLRETNWRVEWCELRVTAAGRLYIFYTKSDASCGFVGSTKKAPLRWIKLDRLKMRIVVRLPLEEDNTDHSKFLQFRVLSTEEAETSRHQNTTETLENWWAAITRLAAPSKPDERGFYDMGQTTGATPCGNEPHELPLTSLLFQKRKTIVAAPIPIQTGPPSARYIDVDLQ